MYLSNTKVLTTKANGTKSKWEYLLWSTVQQWSPTFFCTTDWFHVQQILADQGWGVRVWFRDNKVIAVYHSPSLQLQFSQFPYSCPKWLYEDVCYPLISASLIFLGYTGPWLKQVRGKRGKRKRRMLLKENPFFKIKQLSEYDRQYNGNKIMYLFFLCGRVPLGTTAVQYCTVL